VIAAAKAAGVNDMILRLPEGYESDIGEGGTALSAGQRQRLPLAARSMRTRSGGARRAEFQPRRRRRAGLDARPSSGVRARGGIAVVIAHRPSALAGVDLVLMMAEGKAQAFGPKDEVLNKVLRRTQPAQPVVPLKVRRRRPDERRCHERSEADDSRRRSSATPGRASPSVRVLVGAVGGWAGTTRFPGAVVAPVSSSSNRTSRRCSTRRAASSESCGCRTVRASRWARSVMRLDETVTQANLAIVRKTIDEFESARPGSRPNGTTPRRLSFRRSSSLERSPFPMSGE
jgi:hypothetical protein